MQKTKKRPTLRGQMSSFAKKAKNNLIEYAKAGLKGAAAEAGKQAIRAFIYRSNDDAWYLKYRDITPAANKNRPMEARFNKDITTYASNGSVCKFLELHLGWTDFNNSFMWKQMINNSYQLLRLKLKSNLPYTSKRLEAYIYNAIQAAILVKQIERDVHWYNYSDPETTNFPEMFKLRAVSYGSFGVTQLQTEPLLGSEWADTVTAYERLVSVTKTSLRVAPSLALFISHYFGSIFTTQSDGYNDNYLILRMMEQKWATYHPKTDTTEEYITYSNLYAGALSLDQVTAMIVDLATQFGMVISDLVNSDQYVPIYIDELKNYTYDLVYDPSLMQAIRNGYTSKSAVTSDGYVRIDESKEATDKYTQFIFMGALQPNNVGDLTDVAALRILSMCLKYDSDKDLTWAGSYAQQAFNEGTSKAQTVFNAPFGVNIITDIEQDVYVTNYSAQAENLSSTYPLSTHNATQIPARSTTGHPPSYSTTVQANVSKGTIVNYAALPFDKGTCTVIPIYEVDENADGTSNDREVYLCLVLDNANGFIVTYQCILNFAATDTSSLHMDVEDAMTMSGGTTLADATTVKTIAGTSLKQLPTGNFLVETSSITNINSVAYARLIANVATTLTWQYAGGISAAYTAYLEDANVPASTISLTNAYVTGDFDSADASNETSVVTGYLGLPGAVAQDINAYIPMYPKMTVHSTSNAGVGADGANLVSEVTVEVQQPLIKKEHIPYWYNIKDLKPVIFDMFTSLFTPVDNIYDLLTLRKGGTDKSGKRKDGRKRDTNKPPKETNKDERTTKETDGE